MVTMGRVNWYQVDRDYPRAPEQDHEAKPKGQPCLGHSLQGTVSPGASLSS